MRKRTSSLPFVMVPAVLTLVLVLVSTSKADLKYTTESTVLFGKSECITNCVNGECLDANKDITSCMYLGKTAPTYYTARYLHPDVSTCLSKCVYGDRGFSWCYVDESFLWDYCNPVSEDTTKWYQYSKTNGRCRTKCSKTDGYDNPWCYTEWNSWDYCEETYFYGEDVKTAFGIDCLGDCFRHDGSYYWCYDMNRQKQICAPSAVVYHLHCPSRHRPTRSPPTRTVAEYNQEIDNDSSLTTVTLSTELSPDLRSPILDYTYRTTATGLTLPVRIRARILPAPFQHIQASNSRTGSDISSEAERNCRTMGMNVCLVNGNNDQLGHLVPYILGGPGDWFNVVPQTRRINVGTVTNTDVVSPSIWSETERIIRRWVEAGGIMDYQVFVTYNLSVSTRPTGFGTVERGYLPDGTLQLDCPGYWFSNDPYEDPDEWNNFG